MARDVLYRAQEVSSLLANHERIKPLERYEGDENRLGREVAQLRALKILIEKDAWAPLGEREKAALEKMHVGVATDKDVFALCKLLRALFQ